MTISDNPEKIPVRIFNNSEEASIFVAQEIATLIRQRQREKKKCILGLATGSTPTRVYAELVKMHKKGLSFKNVVTFNLDEYYPIRPDSLQSYFDYEAYGRDMFMNALVLVNGYVFSE